MSAKLGTFSGANVFLSRNLVPPEIFDAIHDALRLNGAHVFLCCDPSRTAPDDYHVISSSDHEKFADLKAKGCNLVGPQCIFSCAKEHRMLPKRGYTCCIAMDGVKVLASGFDKEERTMIENLVIAMGGVLQTKTSMDVNFVIVKNVLAAKYKWALHVLKKPVVSMSWLCQCWIEHRVVPQEPYKVLPFMGLTICVTRIPVDERKEIARLIVQNGGKYSADLTKNCSHLVSDAPTGDKYVVAKRWGHIRIVGLKWIEQSISKRACLDERLYPVHEIFASGNDAKFLHKEQSFQEPSNITSQLVPPSTIDDEEAASSLLDISVSENCITKNDVIEERSINLEDIGTETNLEQMGDIPKFDCRVAPDSDEDCDYLSSCRIFLAGFEGKELRRLVNMIRSGGGTRHVFLSARLTHIIIGTPSEAENRELRPLVALGAINLVNAAWLEESDHAKRELPVSSRHNFSILKVSKAVPVTENKISSSKLLSNKKQGTNESSIITNDSAAVVSRCKRPRLDSIKKSNLIDERKLNSFSTIRGSLNRNATFKGKSFCFSSSFPIEHRVEVIEWVKGGGGMMLDDHAKDSDFIIESHGLPYVVPTDVSSSTAVTTHWIRTSLEECCIQDVSDHMLYSPLHCHIPLPGIEGLCFCVSQYEGKDRILLRNLCFVLGAKFTEKLTKKVTHLLCKFTSGPKYDAACRKGIQTVTAEWIAACVSQDKLVTPDSFQPRPVTSEDKEAGLCTESQYPTQAAHMICFTSQSQNAHQVKSQQHNRDQPADVSSNSKIPEGDVLDGSQVMKAQQGKCKVVPDVADAIEDFLAQTDTNKIQDLPSAAMSGGESNIYAPDQANIGKNQEKSHAASSLSGTNKLKRTKKQDKSTHSRKKARNSGGPYEPFSETQTESQVVGYEEDLSGRQKIIERIRSQSFTLTPDIRKCIITTRASNT